MKKVISGKLHGIKVTDANIDYHGSITLDPEHCEKANIMPMEFVEIWNKNSGARISTYVIFGERGSSCCVLNGAAARTCQPGDELIVCAYEYITQNDISNMRPRILTFDANNNISEIMEYEVGQKEDGVYFNINRNLG